MGLIGLLMLLPTAVVPLLLVLGGLALIVGARGFAKSLFILVGVMVIAPVVLGPLLAAIPTWMLLLSLPIMGFAVAGMIVSGLFGRRVWAEALGHRLAGFIGPLWLFGTVIVLLFAWL